MVKSRSQASTWLRGDFTMESAYATKCIQPTTSPGPPVAAEPRNPTAPWPGPPRDQPRAVLPGPPRESGPV